MGRLRIMVRGGEQCVRLISVIVLRVGAIQISDFAQCLVSKAAKFIARKPWLGAGSSTEGTTPGSIILRVLTPMRVQSHAWSFIPGWSFCSSFILAQNPRHLPQQPRARSSSCSDGVSGSCDAVPETASRGLYQKYPFDRSNSGRSRRLRHGDEGRRAPSADVLRRVE